MNHSIVILLLRKWKELNDRFSDNRLVTMRVIKPLSLEEVKSITPGGPIYTKVRFMMVDRKIKQRINQVLIRVDKGEIKSGKLIDHIKKELLK